ncbi:MAG: beta-ketoacyl-ACP synthase II [Pseudomonadota bacterium]
MRRVVVTGMGMISPLGVGVDHNWERLTSAQSGIRAIDRFDVSELPSKIAGLVPDGPLAEGAYDPIEHFDVKTQRKNDQFILFGLVAAREAIKHSGWAPESDEDRNRTGVMVGSGIGGLQWIGDGALTVENKGPRKLSPFFIPAALINLASGQISIEHGYRGPNHAVVTACSTGAHAIGDAARLIMLDDADVMIAGGAEAAVCPVGVAGFAAARALSTGFNDTPEKASRPYDKGRDGFVMGEGAGVVVLEELEHAKARGATIYAEVVGYGLSGDAHHITAPAPDGNGGFRSMSAALKRAQLDASEIDYVNAHGTSTPLGDEIELNAVRRLFGGAMDTVSMSSTKSAVGHLLGAAGAVEAIYSVLSIVNNVVPPTLNLENPSEGCEGVDLVPLAARERSVKTALSNSFGFGGTNASLVFRQLD